MVKYNEVKIEFEKHGCKLSMTEEEFNIKPRIIHENYPYIAKCTHKHEVCFNNFRNRLTGVECPDCVKLKQSIDKKEKYKNNPILSQGLEFESIEHIKTLIGDTFDVKNIGECCLADFCIRLKHITEDSWLMVQMKSTAKPVSNCVGYTFKCSSKYKNCIIMCFCASDKKMWVFDGNKTNTKCIHIGLKKSKYDEFEITKDTIRDILTHYYNTIQKYDFETIDTPITPHHKLENEYRKYREENITCINFIRNERQGLVYDFKVNGFKVQEKVNSQVKNQNGITFSLDKSNGRKKTISYQQGDNDFYWLNVNNKKHFYIIPEHELISRTNINTDKANGIYLIPNSKKGKNVWANEYLFDYTNITKIDEEKIKRMFHLI